MMHLLAMMLALPLPLILCAVYLVDKDRGFRHRKARRALLLSAQKWDEAAPGELASLEGIVEALTESTETPLSRKRSVWHRLRGFEQSRGERARKVADVVTSHDFVVRGPAGTLVVTALGEEPTAATTSATDGSGDEAPPDITERVETGTVMSVSDAVQTFLAARGKPPLGSRDGFLRQYEFEEQFLEVGTPLVVVARKPPEASSLASYRTSEERPRGEQAVLLARTATSVLRIGHRTAALVFYGVSCFALVVVPVTWLRFAVAMQYLGASTK
jgi:hypothetical protein